ncbi:MAG: hypothetical protein US50_C0028G0003 [Candidatus Nomurabacteria bacterium GW2011_GWB1_37_5]|uniref:Uncharacterized protein n=1 Tax=Candidatus Nomurabacteria bacterium GW2011_GWB1_37_5 TaxID=1618742 RepID=A0A0G0JE24_9BACT|nr:MAG: hypothetical protein US50_C0028G0003 [Candidatus Nomurabacteria bacterium GW2011_GWB1_37_5]
MAGAALTKAFLLELAPPALNGELLKKRRKAFF